MLPAPVLEGQLGKRLFGHDHLRLDGRSDQSGIATRSEAGERVKRSLRDRGEKVLSNTSAFGPSTSIVGKWRDISDQSDLKASYLQSPNSCFTP